LRIKKRYAVLILALAFLLGTLTNAGAENPIWLYVNGKLISNLIMVDGRVYVPIRAVAENMGATVGWDQRTNTAYVASQRDALTEIEIVGPLEFQKAMRDGLELLKAKAPEEYKFVGRYVGKVSADNTIKSGLSGYNDMSVFITSDYKPDPYWWAGAFVHEGTHNEQIYNVRGGTIEQLEMEAVKNQLEVLRKINAPAWIVDYVRKSPATKWWEQSPIKN